VRRSGLTYFMVRPGELEDRPGGGSIRISQDLEDDELTAVSRTDVAEVVVSALLDPRACNVACTLTSSEYAQLGGPKQDVSKLLEVMKPNRM